MKQLVITLIGPDRSGLVERVSDAIFSHHGSWQASSLSKLAGQFAGILQIDVSDAHADDLIRALRSLDDLQVLITETAKNADTAATTHTLSVTGNDRPGIIQEVTRELAKFGININKLKTHAQSAATSGGVIFTADFHLDIAPDITLTTLRDALEQLSDDLIVEFDSNDIR